MLIEDKIVQKRINEIRPYVRNPRRNEKTVELLCKLIPKVGFNVPIVIDEKGIIVKGHARYGAAIRLGMETVPCIVSHASPEAIKADRITDNKISEFSEWINDEVLKEIESIKTDIDFSELGFPAVRFDGMPSEGLRSPSEGLQADFGVIGGLEPLSPAKGQEKPLMKHKLIKRERKC